LLRSEVFGPHRGAMVLRLGMIRPVSMLAYPVGMVSRNPVRVLVVPPFAVVPVVLRVVGAILIAPIRLPGNPLGMIGVKEVRIVLMPPVGVMPLVVVVVVAILAAP